MLEIDDVVLYCIVYWKLATEDLPLGNTSHIRVVVVETCASNLMAQDRCLGGPILQQNIGLSEEQVLLAQLKKR